MDSYELIPRTNSYRVCEDPASPSEDHEDPALLEDLPVLDLDTGELLSDDHRPPSRRADGTTQRAVPPPVSDAQPILISSLTSQPVPQPRIRLPSAHAEARRVDRSTTRHYVPRTPAPFLPTVNFPQITSTNSTVPEPFVSVRETMRQSARPMLGIRRPRDSTVDVPPATLHRGARVLPGPLLPEDDSSDEDEPAIHYSPPRTPAPPPMEGFIITTDCSEPTDDVEEPSSAAVMADIHRRDRAAIYAEDSDNESTTEDPEIARVISQARARVSGMRRPRDSRLDFRRELPSQIEISPDWEPGLGSETGPLANTGLSVYEKSMIETQAQMKGVLAPHARFFIEKEASCVTVNFEPEV